MKPIIKFNNRKGAILCNECHIIIKERLNKEEFKGNTDLLYCDKCVTKNRTYMRQFLDECAIKMEWKDGIEYISYENLTNIIRTYNVQKEVTRQDELDNFKNLEEKNGKIDKE